MLTDSLDTLALLERRLKDICALSLAIIRRMRWAQ